MKGFILREWGCSCCKWLNPDEYPQCGNCGAPKG